jgi:hypothetical protein
MEASRRGSKEVVISSLSAEEVEWKAARRTGVRAGSALLLEPSDGLEPSTPSCHALRSATGATRETEAITERIACKRKDKSLRERLRAVMERDREILERLAR